MPFGPQQTLPRAVRHLLAGALLGAVAGTLTAAGLLWSGEGHLRQLLLARQESWLAPALFLSGMVSTFAGLGAGTALMLAARRSQP